MIREGEEGGEGGRLRRGQAFLASAAEASGCSRPGPPLHTCSGPQRLAKPSAGRVAAVRV